MLVAVVAAALLTARSGQAEPPPLSAPTVLDPLRLTSLPLHPADGFSVAAGRWRLEASVGYLNVQESTWHAATVRRDLGLVGQQLTSNEVALIERGDPDDEVYLIDLEG